MNDARAQSLESRQPEYDADAHGMTSKGSHDVRRINMPAVSIRNRPEAHKPEYYTGTAQELPAVEKSVRCLGCSGGSMAIECGALGGSMGVELGAR